MRFAAILDGTSGGAARQAQALGGFLHEGLSGDLAGETLVFYRTTTKRRGSSSWRRPVPYGSSRRQRGGPSGSR